MYIIDAPQGAEIKAIINYVICGDWLETTPNQALAPGLLITVVNDAQGYQAIVDEMRRPGVLAVSVSGSSQAITITFILSVLHALRSRVSLYEAPAAAAAVRGLSAFAPSSPAALLPVQGAKSAKL